MIYPSALVPEGNTFALVKRPDFKWPYFSSLISRVGYSRFNFHTYTTHTHTQTHTTHQRPPDRLPGSWLRHTPGAPPSRRGATPCPRTAPTWVCSACSCTSRTGHCRRRQQRRRMRRGWLRRREGKKPKIINSIMVHTHAQRDMDSLLSRHLSDMDGSHKLNLFQ